MWVHDLHLSRDDLYEVTDACWAVNMMSSETSASTRMNKHKNKCLYVHSGQRKCHQLYQLILSVVNYSNKLTLSWVKLNWNTLEPDCLLLGQGIGLKTVLGMYLWRQPTFFRENLLKLNLAIYIFVNKNIVYKPMTEIL